MHMAQELSIEYQNTIQQILSSFEEQFMNSPSLSALKALSAIPPHPYEQMKFKLLGKDYKDYKFKTIDDVPFPGFLDKKECQDKLKKCTDIIYQNINHNLSAHGTQKLETVFHTLSNNVPVWDKDSNLKMLEFAEVVKSIPVNGINVSNAYTFANKLLSEFTKVFDSGQVS